MSDQNFVEENEINNSVENHNVVIKNDQIVVDHNLTSELLIAQESEGFEQSNTVLIQIFRSLKIPKIGQKSMINYG